MPNGNRHILSMLESYFDMFINLVAYAVSYVFVIMLYGPVISIIDPGTLLVLFANLFVCTLIYHILNLYKPNRYLRTFRSLPAVLQVNGVYYGINAIITAFVARTGYKEFVLFWILFAAIVSTAFLTFKRHTIKVILRTLRQKQYNLRKIIIIGDNTSTAAAYVKEVTSSENYGAMLIGFVGDKIDEEEVGIDKLGSFRELSAILDKYNPTDVVFAIDAYDKRHLIKLVNMCDDRCIKVYFLPVIYGFFKTSRQIEQVGRVPLINIHSTPLDNRGNAIIKRAMDIIGSILLILITSPIMIATAIGVKATSPGPIFFKQKRIGVLGKPFTMLKFRSMRVNDESDKAWTTGEDPRKTKFGTFIRRTAIDELPQLFNVLAGSMSLVGPRPEIPVFVDYFREIIPLYMIKHYVKPGITGLAQINGLRGDTSIEERIHKDIEYIEHWSILLDIAILLKTPFKAINRNEKYVTVDAGTDKKAPTSVDEIACESKEEPLAAIQVKGSSEETADEKDIHLAEKTSTEKDTENG